jgi:hypothetical protein
LIFHLQNLKKSFRRKERRETGGKEQGRQEERKKDYHLHFSYFLSS